MSQIAASSPLAQALRAALSRYPALDPRAVMAVASQEGLGGGIGDQGTSFGPFQLHQGGAYPSFAPQQPQAAQAWASSPQGLDYALRQIQGVAGGLRGAPAVTNIVSRFERPANIPREIAGATAAYGGLPPAANALMAPGTTTIGAPPAARAPAARAPALALARALPAAVQAALRILSS